MLTPLITIAPETSAPPRHQSAMKGSTLACLAWLSAEKSTQLRTRQNRSCRCSISGDRNAVQRLDLGAGLGEQPGRRFDRRLHLGIDRQARARVEMQADLQALGLERTGAPVDVGRRQAHVVARIGLGQLGHQQRGVGHGARHRPDDAAEERRIDRHAAEAGLQGEDAVPAWPAGAPSRRYRCRDAAGRSRPPPPRPRRRSSRRDSRRGSRDCASADGTSCGPTTACRSRAWWSWRG